jgi:hypothetical protein
MVATVCQHGAERSGGKDKFRPPFKSRRKADKLSLRVREGAESRPDSLNLPERRRCVKRRTAGS